MLPPTLADNNWPLRADAIHIRSFLSLVHVRHNLLIASRECSGDLITARGSAAALRRTSEDLDIGDPHKRPRHHFGHLSKGPEAHIRVPKTLCHVWVSKHPRAQQARPVHATPHPFGTSCSVKLARVQRCHHRSCPARCCDVPLLMSGRFPDKPHVPVAPTHRKDTELLALFHEAVTDRAMNSELSMGTRFTAAALGAPHTMDTAPADIEPVRSVSGT